MREREDVQVTQSDYRTVQGDWLGKRFIEEAEKLKQYDEKRYRWIYLGEVIGIEGLIYNPDLIRYKTEDTFKEERLRIIYVDFVADGGHQTSATTCLAIGYATDGNWYLLDTYYYSPHEKGVKKAPSELSLDIFNFEIAVLKQYQTTIDDETIDSAEGALRNQLFKDYGKRFRPVNKGKKVVKEIMDSVKQELKEEEFDNAMNELNTREEKDFYSLDEIMFGDDIELDEDDDVFDSDDLF
jgi:phage terminase large subunit